MGGPELCDSNRRTGRPDAYRHIIASSPSGIKDVPPEGSGRTFVIGGKLLQAVKRAEAEQAEIKQFFTKADAVTYETRVRTEPLFLG